MNELIEKWIYLYYLDEYSCKNILNLLYNIEIVECKYINGILDQVATMQRSVEVTAS